MKTTIVFLVGLFIGAFAIYFAMRRGKTSGIASHTQKQQDQKQTRKEKILEILKEKGSVVNDEIEKSLGVTDTTATNYLQELEREGKIEQVGERGRFVSYRLKT